MGGYKVGANIKKTGHQGHRAKGSAAGNYSTLEISREAKKLPTEETNKQQGHGDHEGKTEWV